MDYPVSDDGVNYKLFDTCSLGEDRSPQVKFVKADCKSTQPVEARYIKISVTGAKICPHWYYGVGNPSWFFIDEVNVY